MFRRAAGPRGGGRRSSPFSPRASARARSAEGAAGARAARRRADAAGGAAAAGVPPAAGVLPHQRGARARSSSTPRSASSTSCRATTARSATASASAATASTGRAFKITPQAGMAGLAAAAGNDPAPALSAALHGRRARQSDGRARALPRRDGLPASTAPISRGRSATPCRRAASVCVNPRRGRPLRACPGRRPKVVVKQAPAL